MGKRRAGCPDPGVVVFEGSGAEHHFLGPVGGGPTGGDTGFDADAPGGVTVGDDGVHEGDEFIPGGGDFITGGVELGFGVPDEAFAVEAMPDTGALTVHLGHIEPALIVLLAQPIGGDVG